eukprot:8221525-Prorocentrum_lima.AAC.1
MPDPLLLGSAAPSAPQPFGGPGPSASAAAAAGPPTSGVATNAQNTLAELSRLWGLQKQFKDNPS